MYLKSKSQENGSRFWKNWYLTKYPTCKAVEEFLYDKQINKYSAYLNTVPVLQPAIN